MIKLGGATVNQIPFDWKHNRSNILEAIEAARKDQVKILCLPELCITGYGCEDQFLSEWLVAKAWNELLTISSYCRDITVSIGLPVRIEGTVYNGACLIHDTRVLGITFKQNLANDGVHYEPRWFKPWPTGVVQTLERDGLSIPVGDVMYNVDNVRIGFEICEDGWQKNRPGYALYERGVDIILNPSASHFAMGKSLLREGDVVLKASTTFKCVYLFVNLLGNEAGRMIYDGDIIIAQHDKLLAVNKRFSYRNVNLISCMIDLNRADRSEFIPSQDSKDKNEELGAAIALGLHDYLRKSKAKGFVLSLSGGADSSICAIMVAEMVRRSSLELGWPQFNQRLALSKDIDKETEAVRALLTCAYQGTINSSDTTLQAAKELAFSVGATFHQWLIDDEVRSYTEKIETAINRKLDWQMDDIALQNIQARSRSPIIWMLANVKQSILLTTSNRSEGDVGYATMDGDTSGSLAPIAGLSKVFIIQWLKWAEAEYPGLKYVNNLKPTAELRPLDRHQTDEDDLMPYTVLLAIEQQAILHRKGPVEVWESLKTEYPDRQKIKQHIRKFFRLWTTNQWKRERLAPSFHVDELNVDPRTWCRFPILSSGFAEELEALDHLF